MFLRRKKNNEFSFSTKLMPKLVGLGHIGFMLANVEFSFSTKLMPKLVGLGHIGFMLANVIVFYSVFSFKISNIVITNYRL